jgi:hypothetical protein
MTYLPIKALGLILMAAVAVRSSADLEAAFVQHYEPSQALTQLQDDANLNLSLTQEAFWPRLQLDQTFNWQNYQTTSLQATASLNWDLFDTKHGYQLRIAEIAKTLAELEKTTDRTQALFTLRGYTQGLNTYEVGISALQTLETDIRKARPLWTPDTPSSKFAPVEIEPYLKFLEFVETRKTLELQSNRIRKQISKWTKIAVEELGAGRIQYPGDVLLPSVDQNKCINESVTIKRALLRLEQEKQYEAMRFDVMPTISLNANGSYSTAPTSGQPNLSGQVSLQAAFRIPPNAPVSANTQITATPAGLTQTASFSFPNLFRSADPQGVKWAQKNLEDAREVVTTDLTELLRTRTAGLETLKLDQQRLDWSERSLKDAAKADELVKINARFALMGLKVRGFSNHLNVQLNALNLAQLCQLPLTYAPRNPLFDLQKSSR